MQHGFWVGRGTPASVDWCEPNYVVTPFVAEWWNTLSSVWIVALGAYGLWCWWRLRPREERRFGGGFVGLILVGLGSVAFHGTLLRGPQALDELPMVYGALAGAWALWHRRADRAAGRPMAAGMALYAVCFTVAYFAFPELFLLFSLTFLGVATYVTLSSIFWTWIRPAPALLSALLAVAASCFLGATFFFWLPEHVLLSCDHPLQDAQLHALWHLGSGTGVYAWLLWVMADRARTEGTSLRWSRGFVVAGAD